MKVKDTSDENICISLLPAIEYLDLQLQRTNVLVHCFAGISRSPTIVLAYLMVKKGLSLTDAFFYVKDKRYCIKPTRRFLEDLLQFEVYINRMANSRELHSLKSNFEGKFISSHGTYCS